MSAPDGEPRSRTRLVIPCYNEESRLDVGAVEAFLRSQTEIGLVLVNDGSRDGTLRVLRDLEERWPDRVLVVDQQPNGGKAEAVRVGMLRAVEAGAALAGYFDADLATPLEAVADFVAVLDRAPQVDIVMGARVALLGREIDRSPIRHYAGRVFATAASIVLALAVYDTQCGAKLLRLSPRVAALFGAPFGSRWIFDVELLGRYLAAGGTGAGIYEVPLVKWTDVGESRVRPLDFVRAGGELASIYRSYGARIRPRVLLAFVSAPFTRYAAAGLPGTVLHYAVLAGAVVLLRARPECAAAVGAGLGAVVNWFVREWILSARKTSAGAKVPRLVIAAALSVLVSGGGVWLLVSSGWPTLAAQAVCTAVVLLVGFAGLGQARPLPWEKRP